jgi:hypothetical protein
MSTVVHLLPHGGKSLGFSGNDYSGSASDSGYSSGAPKYVPSQKLLEREFSFCKTHEALLIFSSNGLSNTMNLYLCIPIELNPDAKTVDDRDEYVNREDVSTKGYNYSETYWSTRAHS